MAVNKIIISEKDLAVTRTSQDGIELNLDYLIDLELLKSWISCKDPSPKIHNKSPDVTT